MEIHQSHQINFLKLVLTYSTFYSPFLGVKKRRSFLFERLTMFLFYCVPTPQINYHRNGNVVFQYFISRFFTFIDKHEMLVKVFKTKDFYIVSLCSNDTHSTCPVCGNISTGCTSCVAYPPSSRMRKSRASVDGLQDT